MRAAIKKAISLDFARSVGSCLLDAQPAEQAATELKGVALLVTEDSLSLQWAPRWLQQVGFDVQIAGNASEALKLAAQVQPRVLIADAATKGADKRTTLHVLRREFGAEIPLIALCASSTDVNVAHDAGATDIVRRPYEWDLITRRVVKAVDAQQIHNDLRSANAMLEELNSTASRAERERVKTAGMDQLTQLPNLEKFRKLLHKATAGPYSTNKDLCLLVIGIDRFRLVNDAIGYQNANVLLSQFASRLRNCLRDRHVIGDTDSGSVTAIAARIAGARFALLVSHGDVDQIQRVNKAISRQLEQPFEVAGQSVYLTASVGAAIYPRDCESADELLRYAESAMRDAQELGTGFRFYKNLEDTSSGKLLTLDTMLREAVRNDELTLAYQPITDANTGEIVAAEALLRWEHPEEGMISPELFVPVAENSGLMTEIGDFVINHACCQLGDWIDAGMKPIRMAINLSLCQLLRGDIVTTVAAALEDNNLVPELLEFELSERGVLNRNPEVLDVVAGLKALGVRISIDDFGTGNAAIGYLKDLPIDVIKIDRSYISGVDRSERDEAIASGMVALAQRLDATVVAEGVETEEQLEMLRDWGSQECQGFYFCAAIPGDEFQRRFTRTPGF